MFPWGGWMPVCLSFGLTPFCFLDHSVSFTRSEFAVELTSATSVNEFIHRVSDITVCFCGNAVWYKRLHCAQTVNCKSDHLSCSPFFSTPWKISAFWQNTCLYHLSFTPNIFSEMLSEASWDLPLGSFRVLFSDVGCAPTQACKSPDMPQLVFARGYLLTCQLKMGAMRYSKNLLLPILSTSKGWF